MTQLTAVSFKGTKFASNSMSEKFGDIPKLDFSLIFNIVNIKSLNLSYSNFIQVISDLNLTTFCSKFKELSYLGLAGIQTDYTNLRKYR